MTRKPQKRTQITRARILSSAKKLAAATPQGLESLTAEAIAQDAEIAKGTVFAHFGDMDGLLSHLLLDKLRALQPTPDTDGTSAEVLGNDPVAAMVHRMMAFVQVITESQTMLRVFMDNIGVTNGHCAHEFVEILNSLDAHLQALLAFWQLSEYLRPRLRQDRRPDEMLDGLIAFMIHSAILYRSHQVDDLRVIRQRLTRHVEAFLIST